MTQVRRWGCAAVLLGTVLAGGSRPLLADSGLGVPAGPVLTVMAATGLGPQALVMVDTSERKILVYTVDQGQIVFAALRPYLYDLAVPLECAATRPGSLGWREVRKTLRGHYDMEFKAFKAKNAKATFEDFLKDGLKDSAGQSQLMTATDVVANQPQLIELLDLANQRLLVYRFTLGNGLEFLGSRNLEFDRKARDRGGRPAYIPVDEVRQGVENAQKPPQDPEE
jgi:hypothetical protein